MIVASDRLIGEKSITAADLTRRIADELGYRGGGKPHMAQVGIPDKTVFDGIREFVKSELTGRR